MLFLMLLIIFTHEASAVSVNSAGTTLFNVPNYKRHCWTRTDILKLRARQTFEELVPPSVKPDKINSRYLRDTLKYFKKALAAVTHGVNQRSADILRDALLDTIGGHLKSDILPTVRFAYYAGYVPYRHAREIHDFYERVKDDLNTQGLGWRKPERVPQWSNLTVAKILIGSGKFVDPCSNLVTTRYSNNCIHLPLPKLDSDSTPSAIALPFKSKGLVSLLDPVSENILLKYYTTASRCILVKSPVKCRHSDFVNFNNEFWHWMKQDVAPHLGDEKLYAAYGGVLRIAAAVQNYGKGLSRRNTYDDPWDFHRNPLIKLSTAYVCINSDWTPKVYIGMVCVIAISIFLMQVCYNYTCGNDQCNCREAPNKTSRSPDIAYTQIDSNFPAVLPGQSVKDRHSSKSTQRSKLKSKVTSAASVQKQKVYDLNENKEKMMAITITDDSDEEPVSSENSEEEGEGKVDQQKGGECRAVSPPRIETSVAELKLEKRHNMRQMQTRAAPLYSTSTLRRSEATYSPQRRPSETGSMTSTSESSGKWSTSSSKHRLQDKIAWARQMVFRETRRQLRRSSGTELDAHSSATTSPQPKWRR